MTTENKTTEECSDLATSNPHSPLPHTPAVPTHFPAPPVTCFPQRHPTKIRPQRPQTRTIRQEIVVDGDGRGDEALTEQAQVTESTVTVWSPLLRVRPLWLYRWSSWRRCCWFSRRKTIRGSGFYVRAVQKQLRLEEMSQEIKTRLPWTSANPRNADEVYDADSDVDSDAVCKFEEREPYNRNRYRLQLMWLPSHITGHYTH